MVVINVIRVIKYAYKVESLEKEKRVGIFIINSSDDKYV